MAALLNEFSFDRIREIVREELDRGTFAPEGSFSWALLQMKAGKKVTLPDFPDWFFMAIERGRIMNSTEDGYLVDTAWGVMGKHLVGEDWSLYEGEEA